MQKNKFTTYLLYAIGEILLVVIGILIAVSINNWNSDRIQKKKETIYLSNLKRDLRDQLVTIDLQIEYEENINQVATPIVAFYKQKQTFKIDSIFTASIGTLSGRKTFVKVSPTYSELISSGNLDIISDLTLKDAIVSYYQELERIELVINKNNNLFTDAVFIPNMLSLSEIQLAGEIISRTNAIVLNESRLKNITSQILQNVENELKMINAINFRRGLSILHLELLADQKENTLGLLRKLSEKN